MSEQSTIPGVPYEAEWLVPPVRAWQERSALHIEAPGRTDLFTDPQGGPPKADSPILAFTPPHHHFTLSARVSVRFASTFDAGVLVVWAGNDQWAKLCFEFSPQGEPMVVTVVNNGVSDDCNSVALARNDVYLRVSRLEPAFAFHYSEDGEYWRMVRYFTLARRSPLQIGFSSQSPTGDGCSATFDSIRYTPAAIASLRDGA